jgi:hypothetical protein
MCNELVFLFSRIGIFTKIYNNNQIIISDKWFIIFNNKIKLFNNLIFKHNNKLNNIILDEIIEINIIDSSYHPKVYDLTIPSTFNFGIANGLLVRDTAQTGYIQRQLIKGLEDLSIKYDGTNRNAKNTIIQLVYGENGINQATQTSVPIQILSMNNIKLEKEYKFSKEQLDLLSKKLDLSSKELNKFNDDYFDKIKYLRDQLRYIQSAALLNFKVMEEKYMLPVNILRITQDYTNIDANYKIDLSPFEIVNSIEHFLNDYDNRLITVLKKDDKFLKQDDRDLKFLLEIALYDYLAPLKCIFNYKLTKNKFNELMKEIKLNYHKAIVEPGEMVGVIAAQSIAEPTSQMSTCKHVQIKLIKKKRDF